MDDVRYRILNNENEIIFCNLCPKETDKLSSITSISQQVGNQNLRAGLINNKHGSVYAFTSQSDYFKSSRKFKTVIEAISNSIGMITSLVEEAKDQQNKSTSRLIHNLTSLNAHNIQEIYSLIPQENVSKKMGGKLLLLKK